MADADGRMIPYLGEDMGEGVRDFFGEREELIDRLSSMDRSVKDEFKWEPGESQDEQPSLKKVFEKIEALERKINHIFDGHVLMDGQFKKIL